MEPERRIEKLLRAFAKKRREQAGEPMELHSVARQQLQKEIARRSAGTNRPGWFSSLFLGLKPGLAFAVAFCVIALVVIGFIHSPNSKAPPSMLASLDQSRDDLAPAQKTAPTLSPPPVVAEAPVIAGEGTRAFQEQQQFDAGIVAVNPAQPQLSGANVQTMAPAAETRNQADALQDTIAQTKMPTGAAVASAAPSTKETLAFKSDGTAAADSFGGAGAASTLALNKDAANQPLPSAPPSQMGTINVVTNGITLAANEDVRKKLTTESVAPATGSAILFERKNEVAATTPPVSKVFNRSDILNANRRTSDTLIDTSKVLLSFRVEQTGNALRVFDADGSVYTGAVQVAQQESVARAGAPKTVAPAAQFAKTAAPARQPAQNYFFRVAGHQSQFERERRFLRQFDSVDQRHVVRG